MSTRTTLDLGEQMLGAVAYAHENRVIHCDVKPENFIVFPNRKLRLSDFGIAKVAYKTQTLRASGAGTVGYVAPEQALGKPSFRSDVFSLGLILYRMFSGSLPEWPYEWPPPNFDRLKRRLPLESIAFLRRSMEVDERKRFQNARHMAEAFQRVRTRTLRHADRKRAPRQAIAPGRDWQTVRLANFRRQHGTALEARDHCKRCDGPVSEAMLHCPWCSTPRRIYDGKTTFPERCGRCGRGVKRDWRYCAWCYGEGFEVETQRAYTDTRYSARCAKPGCTRKDLMPFMRYCPWCRSKVHKKWKVPGCRDKCHHCGWGVLTEFWDFCPWCSRKIDR